MIDMCGGTTIETYSYDQFELIPEWYIYLESAPQFSASGTQSAYALQMYADGGGGAAGAPMVSLPFSLTRVHGQVAKRGFTHSHRCTWLLGHPPCFPLSSCTRQCSMLKTQGSDDRCPSRPRFDLQLYGLLQNFSTSHEPIRCKHTRLCFPDAHTTAQTRTATSSRLSRMGVGTLRSPARSGCFRFTCFISIPVIPPTTLETLKRIVHL